MPPTILLNVLESIRRRVRLLGALFGAGVVLAAGIGLLLAAIALDYMLNLAPLPRLFVILLALGAIGYFAIKYIVSPLLAKLNLTDVAGRLEHAFPQFDDRLRSTVNFILTGTPGSDLMKQKVISEAADLAGRVDLSSAIDPRPVYVSSAMAACGMLVALAIAVGVGPRYREAALSRLLDPFGGAMWPKRVQIDMLGVIPRRIPVGDRVEVRMKLTKGGGARRRATVYYQYDNGPVQQELMSRDEDGEYAASVDARADAASGIGTMKIWVKSGDDEKWLAPVSVVQRLAIGSVTATITPPAYTQAPAFDVDLSRAPASTTIGADIALRIAFNKPLAQGSAVTLEPVGDDVKLPEIKWESPGTSAVGSALGGSAAVGALAGGGLTGAGAYAVGHFAAGESTRFHVRASDADGFTNAALEEYEIVVRPDQMPTVQIENPRRNEERTPIAVVPLQAVADDDYGIRTMNLVVDRLGDSAKHWVIPLLTESSAASGATWQKLDPSGDRVRFRMNFPWDLAQVDPTIKAGDVLEYYVQVRDNFDLDGKTHDMVSSGKLRITIISQDQYAQAVADTLRNLAQALLEVKASQNRTHSETNDLRKDTEGKPAFDDGDRAVAERLENQQSTAAAQTKQTAEKLDDLLKEMDENKSPAQGLKDTARDVRDQLNVTAEQPMKDAAAQIDLARQAADPGAHDPALKQAQGDQQTASDQIQKALDRLGNVGDLAQMIDRISDDLRKQEELSKQTADIGRNNLGKTPDQMSAADQQALGKTADDQKALSEKTDKDIAEMQKAGDAMARSDPTSSDAMKQAAQTGQSQSVSANMSKASDDARQNRQSTAQSSQKQAELGLQMMLNQLREAEQRKLEELSRKLEELQKQIAELIQQQSGHNLDNLHLQGDAAVAKQDAKLISSLLDMADRTAGHEPPTPALAELSALQEQTERNTRDIAGTTAALPDGAEPAGHLNRAAERMQRAIISLRAQKLVDAYDPPMVQALASLQDAAGVVAEQKAKADQQVQDKQKETIRAAYVRIRADQIDLDKQTSALDATPRGDDGRLPHGDAVRLARLPGSQGELSERADKLNEDLSALGGIVYVWANKDIVKSMSEVKDALAKPDTGASTQAEQGRVVAQLTAMIDSLAVKPLEKKFEQPGGGGGSGQCKKGLPSEAELRLLKQLQVAINDNTAKLDAAATKDNPGLFSLGQRQGELRGLLGELLKKSSNGQMQMSPPPDDEAKLPEEADDQSIDEQELESKLLNDKPDADPAQHDVDLVGARMSRSQKRLATDLDPGPVTQKIQDRVLANLDQLIEMARQQQAQASSSPSKPGDPQQQRKPGEKQIQPDNQQASGKKTGQNPTGSKPAEQSIARSGDGTPDLSQPIEERLSEWGQTTPRQRQAVIEGASEKVVEKYKSFVDDYYRSLATKATDRGN